MPTFRTVITALLVLVINLLFVAIIKADEQEIMMEKLSQLKQEITGGVFDYYRSSSDEIEKVTIWQERDSNKIEFPNGFWEILQKLPALQELLIDFKPDQVTRYSKELSKFPKVKRLMLEGRVSDIDLAWLGSLKDLEELILFNNNRIEGHGLKSLSGLRNLKYLALAGNPLTPDGLREIKRAAPAVESLYLGNNQLSPEKLSLIAEFPNLKFLAIKYEPLNQEQLQSLENAKRLEELSLDACSLDDAAVRGLERLSFIKRLALNNNCLGNEGMKSIGKLAALEELSVPGLQPDLSIAARIEFRLKRDRDAKYHFNEIDDRGLAELNALTKLSVLEISGNPIVGSGFANWSNPKSLKKLILSGTQLSDKHAENLKQFQEIEFLSLVKTPLTMNGYEKFLPLKKISALDLGETKVDDRIFEMAVEMPNLKELSLSKTDVSMKAHQEFREHRKIPGSMFTWGKEESRYEEKQHQESLKKFRERPRQ